MKGKKDNAKFKGKCCEFKNHADKTLFDISSCKCRSFSVCSCTRDKKNPRKRTNVSDRSKNFKRNGNWRS